ncbi:MAG TPA: ATP-binding protein [Caulobacteraceae bacterium]|nr:ATP-binding protein [Caulobacteraceae bacterium]
MWRAANRSFQAKTVALCLLATVTALTLSFGVFQWQDWSADISDAKGALVSYGDDLAPIAAKAGEGDATALVAARAVSRVGAPTSTALWFPPGGRAPIVLNGGASGSLRWRAATAPIAAYDHGSVRAWIPWRLHGRQAGELVLEAPDDGINQKLLRNSLIAALLALGATGVAGFMARSMAGKVLEPLCALDAGMAEVQATWDLTRRFPVASGDEFGRLTDRFNGLLTHLESYDARLNGSLADLTAAKEQAEVANVTKSQFLANMSHEIRTPLNGVLAMAQVMESGALEPQQRERLKVVRESGVALLVVLNDLLDLSKIEAGRLQLDAAPFDIEEASSSVRRAFSALAEQKGLSFDFEVAAAAKGDWLGDAARVRQVLHNLASNALKFTEAGGVRIVWDATRSADGLPSLVLKISDTGIGIAREQLPRLFGKFVQADPSITRRFGGSGLGLTICRQLVELMGGAIEVESEPGVGTMFTVTLPLPWLGLRQASLQEPATPADHVDISNLRILAAEDNATNRIVLQTVLGAFGLGVHLVEDGRAAVAAWRQAEFDLLLMDIQMPVLDGVSACREIRALEAASRRRRTTIVALSANAMKHQVESYQAAGMDGHIAKPIEIEALHDLLASVAIAEQAEATDLPRALSA